MASENTVDRWNRYLNIVVSPVMVSCSLVGNVLAVLVLSRAAFNRMPMSVYLRFLAIMDTGTIITGLLPRFVLALSGYDIRSTSELGCQFQIYTVYVFTELSAWTLVIVTTERVLSIVKPYKVKLLCTKSKACVALMITIVLFMLANIPIFFLFGRAAVEKGDNATVEKIVDDNEEKSTVNQMVNDTALDMRPCAFKDNANGATNAWYLSHFLKQSLLPFVILLALNCVIIFHLIRRRKTILKKGTIHHSHNYVNVGFRKNHQIFFVSRQHEDVNGTQKQNKQTSSSTARRDASLTVTLLTVNAVFLICTFPIGIYQQIISPIPESNGNGPDEIVFTCLVFVLYLNNTLNFVLYCVTGSRFRAELRLLFGLGPRE